MILCKSRTMDKFVALLCDSSRPPKRKRHHCRLEGVNFVRIPPQVIFRVVANHLKFVATTSATLYMKALIVQLEDKEVAWFHLHEAGEGKNTKFINASTQQRIPLREPTLLHFTTLDAFQSVFWARTRQRISFSISFPSP